MSDKRAVILNPTRIAQAEFVRRDWVVNAEEGTTINDILEPGYWAHVAVQFSPFDRVEVRLETGEWMIELMVLSADRNWARVFVLHRHEMEAAQMPAPPAAKYMVKWRGGHHKWCVVRVSDNEVLQTSMLTSEEAAGWMKNYEAVTTAQGV